jgi:hypothetical protein
LTRFYETGSIKPGSITNKKRKVENDSFDTLFFLNAYLLQS